MELGNWPIKVQLGSTNSKGLPVLFQGSHQGLFLNNHYLLTAMPLIGPLSFHPNCWPCCCWWWCLRSNPIQNQSKLTPNQNQNPAPWFTTNAAVAINGRSPKARTKMVWSLAPQANQVIGLEHALCSPPVSTSHQPQAWQRGASSIAGSCT